MMTQMKRWRLATTLVLIVMITGQLTAVAQQASDCGVALDEARKRYDAGHFDEVEPLLSNCIRHGFSQQEKIKAYKLITLTKLAIDSIGAAFDAAQAILNLNPAFEPDIVDDPQRFIRMITELKLNGQGLLVTSVSKKAENVLKAPASVTIISEDDIRKRGYQDLEQVFHDLPGFDISKGRGAGYSSIYQRGYRSTSNDRTVIMVDGIEQNDLASDNATISRQYPLSNLKRIEVIYGPASTIYGANSFLGVINIVTKTAAEMMDRTRNFGIVAHANLGTYNTRNFDATISARSKDVAFSLTGRLFTSNEQDLTGYKDWDMKNYTTAGINYANVMNLTGTNAAGQYLADLYVKSKRLDTVSPNPYYTINYTGSVATSLLLTAAGASRAASLDQAAISANNGGMDGRTRDWYLKAKIQVSDLTLGVETWRTNEASSPWYNDSAYYFTPNGMRWIYWNTNFFMNYERRLGDKMVFTNVTSYRIHAVDGNTNFENFSGFYNRVFSFFELGTNKNPEITTTYWYRTSNQLKNEMRLLWTPSSKIDVMSGLEMRSSLIQGDYAKSTTPFPDETGLVNSRGLLGTNHFRTYDIGFFSQSTWQARKNLSLILGARLDYNKIRQHGGYGLVFNPRVAVVYSPGRFIFKAIYATAFKDASFLQKYGTALGRELPNPTLEPERVKNFELSAYWQASQAFTINASAYYANYSNVVGTVLVPYNGGTTGQFQPIGRQRIVGVQMEAKYNWHNYTFTGNYTYTNPLDRSNGLRISDIADSRVNLILNGNFLKHLNVNWRVNYISARRTGAGTSGSRNPFTLFESVTTHHLTVGYDEILKGTTLMFGVTNLFDKNYFDPGVREATGIYASQLPQAGRVLMAKIVFKL